MENKFLKNTKTGQVVRWNPHIAAKKNLVPCSTLYGKEDEDSSRDILTSDNSVPDGMQVPTLSPEEGDMIVKKLFGRDVSKVTVAEMKDYADKNGIDVSGEKPTKLEIISSIHATIEKS